MIHGVLCWEGGVSGWEEEANEQILGWTEDRVFFNPLT